MDERKIAFIHDWLAVKGGAEKVLEAALELYPEAPIYTLVHKPEVFADSPLYSRKIIPSRIDRLPFARNRYRLYLPLMPLAVEQFDLRAFEVLVSMSDAVAHGVLTAPDQLHVNYVFTPMRYAWRLHHEYLEGQGFNRGLRGMAARLILHYLRLWDFAASRRVDEFIACSKWIARDIWRVYRRTAEVIYPPVEVDRFNPLRKRDDFYLAVTRLVPYKRLGLLVEAFNELKLPLRIVGSGPEFGKLKKRSGPNIELLGWRPQSEVTDLLERARGFVHAAEEDFGIAPVEALAAGCPVIAYARGGVLESVVDGETGLFFSRPEVPDLIEAIRRIQEGEIRFDPARLHASAERFRKERFQEEFSSFVSRTWDAFSQTEV